MHPSTSHFARSGTRFGLFAFIIIVPVLFVLAIPQVNSSVDGFLVSKMTVQPSQYPLGSDIQIESYEGPAFTWSGPAVFNFTIHSNISTTISIYVFSDAVVPVAITEDLVVGTNYVVVTRPVSLMALPGDRNITFNIIQGANEITIVHDLWIGSTLIFSTVAAFAVLIFALVIIARIGSESSGDTSYSYTPGPDDDSSTMTYVDQSRAPIGKIYCPECKKLIEEGSIFCPECGTRIPRYLRYRGS